MSIRTHKAVLDKGLSSTANPSHRGSIPSGVSFMFGCEETAGPNLTDYGNAGIQDAPSTLTFAGATNTVSVLQHVSEGPAAPVTGTVVDLSPGTNSWFMFLSGSIDGAGLGAETLFQLGSDGANDRIALSQDASSHGSINDQGTYTVVLSLGSDLSSVVENDDYFIGVLYNAEEGTIRVYTIKNTNDLQETSLTAPGVNALDLTFANAMEISRVVAADVYACGFRAFTGSVPGINLDTGDRTIFKQTISDMFTNLKAGTKIWPKEWIAVE